jgi:hypothetical protein
VQQSWHLGELDLRSALRSITRQFRRSLSRAGVKFGLFVRWVGGRRNAMTGRNAYQTEPAPNWKPQSQAIPVTAHVYKVVAVTPKIAPNNTANEHFTKLAARAVKLPKLRHSDSRGGFPEKERHTIN